MLDPEVSSEHKKNKPRILNTKIDKANKEGNDNYKKEINTIKEIRILFVIRVPRS